MIRLENLRHAYGSQVVLDLPRFEAAQGEHWLMLGRSGSGKTTLLHLIGGLIRPQQGRVEVAGADLGTLGGSALDRFRGRHIGIVFQQLHLLGTLTVRQNLLLAQFAAGLPQDGQRVADTLAMLDVADRAEAYPDTLSQGQRQRVVIARAVLNRPRVLLADEPTASLDDVRAAQVLSLLTGAAREAGATLVVATHDARIKGAFAHRLDLSPTEGALP